MKLATTIGISAVLFGLATPVVAQLGDECATAVFAAEGLNAFDATLATTSPEGVDVTLCGFTDGPFNDVWFEFHPFFWDTWTFEVIGDPTYDTRVVVYDASTCPVGGMQVIACDDDGGEGLQSKATTMLLGTQVVLVRVGSANNSIAGRPATLRAYRNPPRPVNDDCNNATVVGLGLHEFDPRGATTSIFPDPPFSSLCGDSGSFYYEVFFEFTPPMTAVYELETVSTQGVGYDTVLAIFPASSCPVQAEDALICDDDLGAGLLSRVRYPLIGGTSYLVAVGRYDAAFHLNPLGLSISILGPPPFNDDCQNATPLVVGRNPFDSSTATYGSGSPLDPMVCDMGPFGDEQIHQDL